MKKVFLFSIMILGLAIVRSFACSFSPIFFCENINQSHRNYHVLTGKIISTIQNGVQFEIIEVLRGVETRDTVVIWDDEPFECNGPWYRLAYTLGEIGDTIVVALPKIDSIENNWELRGDYRVPQVFIYTTSLKLENDTLKGDIAGSRWLPSSYTFKLDYKTFKTSIITQQNCPLRVSTQGLPFESSFQIYPNPFDNQLFVDFSNVTFAKLEYVITSVNGQVLQCGILSKNQVIKTDNLLDGMYVMVIKNEEGVIFSRRKLVKIKS